MFCPTCHTAVAVSDMGDISDVSEAVMFCPTCGDVLHAIGTTNAVGVVESAVEAHPLILSSAKRGGTQEVRALTITEGNEAARMAVVQTQRPGLPALPELAAMAWRQPVVRAAVKTSASAIALSLATRAARYWLTRRAPQRTPTQGLLPTISELLPQHDASSPRGRQDIIISETFIYVRRIRRG